MEWILTPERIYGAMGLVAAYAGMCWGIGTKVRKQRLADEAESNVSQGDAAAPAVLVAYASQTGQAEALARAEQEYGVPAQVIVSIIGVETFYGRNTGNYRVIDALSTLGFDYPPRAEFFRKELREFLLLAREEQVDPLSLKGSYAGAMGLPQFMPSSFRAYAVDFDGDGHINIWSNPDDAIGSVASYFKRHGWVAGEPVVIRADVTGDRADEGLTQGIEPVKTVGELRALGWSSHDALRDDMPVTAFRLEGENGPEYWMGLKNFYAITRYNRSVMYAMAVHQLSDLLVQARGNK